MYIWIETIEVTLESPEAIFKNIEIDIKNFGVEYQILFTHGKFDPLPIPNLNFSEDFRVGSAEGCVMCPSDAELSTQIVVDILEHLKQTGIVIHSIKSDEPNHDMIDFKKIQDCISDS